MLTTGRLPAPPDAARTPAACGSRPRFARSAHAPCRSAEDLVRRTFPRSRRTRIVQSSRSAREARPEHRSCPVGVDGDIVARGCRSQPGSRRRGGAREREVRGPDPRAARRLEGAAAQQRAHLLRRAGGHLAAGGGRRGRSPPLRPDLRPAQPPRQQSRDLPGLRRRDDHRHGVEQQRLLRDGRLLLRRAVQPRRDARRPSATPSRTSSSRSGSGSPRTTRRSTST